MRVRVRSRDAIAPNGIVRRLSLIGRKLRLGRQEDAHEFLRLLLDAFQKEELRLLGIKESGPRELVENTYVHHMFGGYFRNQLKCKVCGHCSNNYDSFLDVSVEIPQKADTLHELFHHFTVRRAAAPCCGALGCSSCRGVARGACEQPWCSRLRVFRNPSIWTRTTCGSVRHARRRCRLASR
jgi:ubiquitin C-terminal hydrolase